tara:strand:- start:177 stop:2558 length:2382 start_codon:yes stop_codon:yes gene_type:complete
VTKYLLNHFTFFYLLLATTSITAQSESYIIKGIILDNNKKFPIPYATIKEVDGDSSKAINITISQEDGQFQLKTTSKNPNLNIDFMGYEQLKIRNILMKSKTLNLGKILLEELPQNLDEFEIEVEKSTMEFKLDKRVFNVGKDISSTGASALEVLNNVPSVNVNIEGQISLRGASGVQILINGKPSVIASEQGKGLSSITADMIEKIEVITNPSAKYEAEGSSGIINIVLKKDQRKGLNGSMSINTGWPHNHSTGISINNRTEKFNLFTQIGLGYRSLPRMKYNKNENFMSLINLESLGTEYRNEFYYNLILGADYYINDNSLVTLSGSYALEIEDQPSSFEFIMDSIDVEIGSWERSENTVAINPKYQYDLQYANEINGNEDHTLIASATGNFFGKDQASTFMVDNFSGDVYNPQQETETNFKEEKHTFKLDYKNPISQNIVLESGIQYVWQNVNNDYAVRNNINNSWIIDTGLTNEFEYQQNVLGLYSTAAIEKNKVGLKGGLRLENTLLQTLLTTTNEENNRNFNNLFPSLHFSYKLNNHLGFQFGYSKRIYRPRLWDLNPFFNIRDNYNIRTGNPNLLPEFTDAFEISSILTQDKVSISMSIYKRITDGVIERLSTFENNVTTYVPYNVGKKDATGIELNAKININKQISLLGDFNYFQFKRTGEFNNQNIDFSAQQWYTKWTSKLKLTSTTDVELSGQYESGYQTIQGEIQPQLYGNIGFRQKLINGKAVISFSIRDLFASRIWVNEIIQNDFSLYSRNFRGRFIIFGFSYGFGKGEAMEYSGARRYF